MIEKNIMKDFEKEIRTNNTKVEHQLKLFKEFQNIEGNISYTAFELETSTFQFELDLQEVSLIELFNHLQLNTEVPFASFDNFFKILKEFIPLDEWKTSIIEEAIIVKILQKKNFLIGSKSLDYSDTIIGIFDNEKITVSMLLNHKGHNLNQTDMINRFLSIINGLGEISIKHLQDKLVNGSFYFPKRTINSYVFADLVMNNTLFSSMLSIDESGKTTKEKDSIYIYFKHPSIGEVRANITKIVAVKGDAYLRGKDMNKDFVPGSIYIRVKITKADDKNSVEYFQDMLSKLFIFYDKEYDTIVKQYQDFIPDFGKETLVIPKNPTTELTIKNIAPEVFVSNYSKKCTNIPTIIDDNEVEQAQQEGENCYAISKNR